MTRRAAPKLQPLVQPVVTYVNAEPGATTATIAIAMRCNSCAAGKALMIARAEGLVGPVYVARGVVGWFPADKLAAAKARWAADRQARRMVRQKLRIDAMLAKIYARDEEPEPDDFPARSIIPAATAKPMRCRGPNSVFALGSSCAGVELSPTGRP